MKDADTGVAAAKLSQEKSIPMVSNTAAGSVRIRQLIWFATIATAVVIVDQLTKFIAEATLLLGQRHDLLGDFLGLRLVYNAGAAFSFGTGATWLLSILASAVVVVIIWIAPRITAWSWIWALSLLLGGALGNLIDRFFKAPGFPEGHVVDFIDYGMFVGNVADIAIVLAAFFMVYLGVRGKEPTAKVVNGGADSDE